MVTRWFELRQAYYTSAVLFAILGATSSDARGQSDSYPGDPVAGSRIFVQRGCVECHSIWGNGGTLGPDFAVVGAGRSLQQLAGLFWNHTPRMIRTVRERGIQWPTFSEEELADIISYIYYVKLFDQPGNPDLGEGWFREKRCAECHAVGGIGGEVGSPLDGYARYLSPVMLAQGMWNDGPTMQAQQLQRRVPIPVFVGRELADILAYIRVKSSYRNRDVELLEPPDPKSGRALFVQKGCVACHGTDGRGTRFGPDLRTATQRLQVSEIAGALWNHSNQMASAMRARGIQFPRFEGTDMADVIAFLYYLRFYESEGNRTAGELAFMRKGCSSCHAGDGRAAIGPDLSTSEAVLTPLGLATAMWNHAPAMYDLIQMESVDWPSFEGEEMRDLSVFLKSLADDRPVER
jgi:cytochrome c2